MPHLNKIAIFIIVLIFSVFFSCKNNSAEYKIENLTGYWEIVEVVSSSQETITFTINETIDYIEVEKGVGFRKKVVPLLDGTFSTTDDVQLITVEVQDNTVLLHYETPYDTWSETVLRANKNKLVIKNENDYIYTYNRFEPINLTE